MNVINWKHEYLKLNRDIETFISKWLTVEIGIDSIDGNVYNLLQYHLNRCCELLIAEVNGGLHEEYQHEVNNLEEIKRQLLQRYTE